MSREETVKAKNLHKNYDTLFARGIVKFKNIICL